MDKVRVQDPMILMDQLAAEVSMAWEGPASEFAERHELIAAAFRRSCVTIIAAIDMAFEAEIEFRRIAALSALQDSPSNGSSELPNRQLEIRMQTPSPAGISVQVSKPAPIPRDPVRPLTIVLFAAAAVAVAVMAMIMNPLDRPATHLRYEYTNPNGCKVYVGLEGPTKGVHFTFCHRGDQ